MSFFKPEDFDVPAISSEDSIKAMANIANAKLAKEGKVLYGLKNENYWSVHKFEKDMHKALLINIQPIENCAHPKEEIKEFLNTEALYKLAKGLSPDLLSYKILHICDCGARVEPTSFKECE